MAPDRDIERKVMDELRSDPTIDATEIAVAVENGVVTLGGFARTYSEKLGAGRVARRVAGVAAVANDIDVRLPELDNRPDSLLARVALAWIQDRLPSAA